MTSYSYDAADRLLSLVQNLAGTTRDVTFGFGYNKASQITSRTNSNAAYAPTQASAQVSYGVNGLNQLTTVNGTTMTYNTLGDLTGDGAKTYGYDALNRMTSVTGATLAYDADGRMWQLTSGGVTTKYLYDGDDMIGEYSSTGALLRRYVHGPADDEPLVWYEGADTSDPRWLVADDKGSVIAVTDATRLWRRDEHLRLRAQRSDQCDRSDGVDVVPRQIEAPARRGVECTGRRRRQ